MHGLIYFVVEGEEEGDALATAEEMVQQWLHSIDYYSMPDDEHFKDIWGDMKVIDADSEEGKRLLEDLIRGNKEALLIHFENAKKEIEKGNYDIASYHLRMAGGHPYSMNAFFDPSEPLVDWKQIEHMKRYISEGNKIWIVPVDIHY